MGSFGMKLATQRLRFFSTNTQGDWIPSNGSYLTAFLRVLDGIDPLEARRRAEEIIQNDDKFPAVAVVWAALMMLQEFSLTALEGEVSPMSRRLISNARAKRNAYRGRRRWRVESFILH